MVNESEYETAEISWSVVEKAESKYFGAGKSKFWAKVSGKDGPYSVGESPIFSGSDQEGTPPINSYQGKKAWEQAQAALDKLTTLMEIDGWVFVETGKLWYEKRFRRRVIKSESHAKMDDLSSQLERLSALHKEGGLSDEEYLIAKKQLLGI